MIVSILAATFLLGFCVFFHELGHYLMGRLVGVKAKIFSIGYGRAIWFKRIGPTIFQIGKFPLGGYVQFYGDNPAKEYQKPRKGHFYSANPWKRILIAFGGPFFSLLLGVMVIFTLMLTGWQPLTNEIQLANISSISKTPAELAGLKTGDKIIAVNGNNVASYEKIRYHIAFANSPKIKITVLRNNKKISFDVTARRSPQSELNQIGIFPAGKGYVQLTQDKLFSNKQQLLATDRIVAVNGKKINSVKELTTLIQPHIGKFVKLEVMRGDGSLFDPAALEKITITAPVEKISIIKLNQMIDLQTKVSLPDIEISKYNKNIVNRVEIAKRNFTTYANLLQYSKTHSTAIKFYLGPLHIRGKISNYSKGLLGLQNLQEGIEAKRAQLPTNFTALVANSIDQAFFTTKQTLVGLYKTISGDISFNKNVAGPIKIVAAAAKSVDMGWATYWFFLANITIILGIMNLLPIPVLDGGHIIFFFIEAVYKPIKPKTVGAITRIGMAILMTLGIYVIFLDLWDVVIKKIF